MSAEPDFAGCITEDGVAGWDVGSDLPSEPDVWPRAATLNSNVIAKNVRIDHLIVAPGLAFIEHTDTIHSCGDTGWR